MNVFIEAPLVTERLGNRLWKLREDFVVYIDSVPIKVPAGFITDSASAPPLAWSICAPMAGPWGEAGVVHDYLYSLAGPEVTKDFADAVLYYIGLYRGAGYFQAFLVWLGVHWFGHKHFKNKYDKDMSNDLQVW